MGREMEGGEVWAEEAGLLVYKSVSYDGKNQFRAGLGTAHNHTDRTAAVTLYEALLLLLRYFDYHLKYIMSTLSWALG